MMILEGAGLRVARVRMKYLCRERERMAFYHLIAAAAAAAAARDASDYGVRET